jgi:hypothetical protein
MNIKQNDKNCFKSFNPGYGGSILVSAKKVELETKKKKLDEMIHTLMINLFRILKNDKLRELSFGFIHDLSYNISIEKGGDLLTIEYKKNLDNHLLNLYEESLNYLKIKEATFIRHMIDSYNDYMNKIGIIQKTLMYYEKNYLAKKNLPNVKMTSKIAFAKSFLNDKINNLVTNFILENIQNDRENLFIDKILINDIVEFLLGLGEESYNKIIEVPLLSTTENYYQKDYLKNSEMKNCIEYSAYVKQRIVEENQRILDMNLSRSKEKIMEKLTDELISKFINDESKMISYIINLIKTNDRRNLIILKEISLFSLQDKLFNLLGKSIEIYGCEIIKEKQKEILNIKTNTNSTQPINIIQDNICNHLINELLDFLDKIEQFKKDLNILNNKTYLILINSKIHNFVNYKEYPTFISKILPKHIDFNFRNFFRNKTNNNDIITYLDKVLNLFKTLEDKDIFELNYRRLLSFRLLNNFFYEEIETKFLGKLKLENGAVFTHRCEVMISDIKSSSSMMEQYWSSKFSHKNKPEFSKINKGLEFNIKVLTQSNWIVNSTENLKTNILLKYAEANENFSCINIMKNFNQFFTSFYHNKLLHHNLFLGSCDVYVRIKNKNYSITMSPFQAFFCILLNKSKSVLNFDEISAFFDINDTKALINNIIPLIKSGIILTPNEEELLKKYSPNKNSPPNVITLSINPNFTSKQQIMKISPMRYVNEKILANETKQEETVFLERKYIIESNIIRIMKSKQTIQHNDLTNELVNALQSVFVPDINVLKQRIESLIERGYIKRSESNYTTYIYSA